MRKRVLEKDRQCPQSGLRWRVGQSKMARRRQDMTRFLAVIALLVATTTAAIAGELHEPAKGSAERKAILDAIRPAIEAQMRTAVEFQINVMLSDGDWAFVGANPQRPGGGEIDPETTAFAGKSDMMD